MTSLAITLLVPTVWYPRTLVMLGGGWAMLPDVHWISPVWQAELHALHGSSVWVDVFWFHRTLDRLDPGDSKLVAAGFLACFLLTTFAAESRSYRAPDPVRDVVADDEEEPTPATDPPHLTPLGRHAGAGRDIRIRRRHRSAPLSAAPTARS